MEEINRQLEDRANWSNYSLLQSLKKEKQQLENQIKKVKNIESDLEVLDELINLSDEDESIKEEIIKESSRVEKELEELEIETFLSEKHDDSNAIVLIHSGAGGTESCDWVAMLFRMYSMWAEKRGFKIEIMDIQAGDEAGYKSITFNVKGDFAYGLLKTEHGVHRLVRISPFDASKRRHTSFASVNVMPEIEDDIEIEIKPEELKIDTFRASGAGGQHVNKTDSAIRITHLPTGIVVTCQNERSQHRNKNYALKILKSKLYQLEQEKKQKELDQVSGDKKKIEWGSQIRSYVLHPYKMVKDHRTNLEKRDMAAMKVLDGEINDFIKESLKQLAHKQKE